MKPDYIKVTARITEPLGTDDYNMLMELYVSKEPVVGLIEQFPWMPFIVTSKVLQDDKVVFELRMVRKKKQE